jgi:uncharacterized protein (DUF362 family)
VVFPDFGVIDGVVANEVDENIPHPVNMGVILASEDCVALDIVASEIMGMAAREVPHVWKAYKMGFGVSDLSQIEVVGENINNIKKVFNRGGFNVRSYRQKIFVAVLMRLKLFDSVYPYLEKKLAKKLLLKIVRSVF